jgi:hypothetical protein
LATAIGGDRDPGASELISGGRKAGEIALETFSAGSACPIPGSGPSRDPIGVALARAGAEWADRYDIGALRRLLLALLVNLEDQTRS